MFVTKDYLEFQRSVDTASLKDLQKFYCSLDLQTLRKLTTNLFRKFYYRDSIPKGDYGEKTLEYDRKLPQEKRYHATWQAIRIHEPCIQRQLNISKM